MSFTPLFLTVSLLVFTNIKSADDNIIRTCEYEAIVKRAALPQEPKLQLDDLFKDTEFVQAFIQRKNCMSNARRREIAQRLAFSKISRFNYIFKAPQIPGYILKLGPIHWTNSFGGSAVREHHVTNRNVSRVAYQQLAEDVIERNHLKHVRVVKKYLYRIPKEHDTKQIIKLSDDNYVVVAEDSHESLLSLEENITRFKDVTEEQLEELRIIAREAYMPDLKIHNCIFGKDDKIYIIDTEQTSRAQESDFFLKNAARMQADTESGLQRVESLRRVQDPSYCTTMIEVFQQLEPYLQMGLEPDDKPTVCTEKLIELANHW